MEKQFCENIIKSVGGHGKYQSTVSILLFLIGVCADFYYFYVSLMETPPFVEYYDGHNYVIEQSNYQICQKPFIIVENISKMTWVYEYNIFCIKWKVSLIGYSICFGAMFGSYIIKFLQRRGQKFCVIFVSFLIILATPFIFIKKFYVLLMSNFFFGFGYISIMILRNSIMTEITDLKYRSFFINANISTGILSAIIYYFIFSIDVRWDIVYSVNALCLAFFVVIFWIVVDDSPCYFYMKNDKFNLIRSVRYIAGFNKRNVDNILNEIEEFLLSNDNLISNDISTLRNGDDVTLINSGCAIVYKKIIIFIFLFFSYFLILSAIVFEIKNYMNFMHSNFYLVNSSMIFSYLFISFLMNTYFFGRKFSLIICFLFIVGIKIVKICFEFDESDLALLFLLIRLILYTSQIPFHTLITESFDTKERLKNYGLLYFFGKVASLISPFILEYLNTSIYDYFIISLSILIIILIFITKETYILNK